MKQHRASLPFSLLAVLPLALPLGAQADAYISATTGSGPNSYRFNEVSGYADLFKTSLSMNAMGFRSSSSAAEDVSQSTFGLDWKISKPVRLGVKHNNIYNGSVDIKGNSLNVALTLSELWDSDLLTRVDLKGANSAYRFTDLTTVKNDTINQTSSSLSLTQDVTESLTLYGGHDQYSYDRNPLNAAIVLMRIAPRKFVNNSTTLLSFPDATNRFGITWRPLEPLTLDISSGKTRTLLDQELKTKRLGVDYQVTDHLNVSAAVSKTATTAVVTKHDVMRLNGTILVPAGTPVMTATDDTYTEFSLGWAF
jgi:hypothetical protein